MIETEHAAADALRARAEALRKLLAGMTKTLDPYDACAALLVNVIAEINTFEDEVTTGNRPIQSEPALMIRRLTRMEQWAIGGDGRIAQPIAYCGGERGLCRRIEVAPPQVGAGDVVIGVTGREFRASMATLNRAKRFHTLFHLPKRSISRRQATLSTAKKCMASRNSRSLRPISPHRH